MFYNVFYTNANVAKAAQDVIQKSDIKRLVTESYYKEIGVEDIKGIPISERQYHLDQIEKRFNALSESRFGDAFKAARNSGSTEFEFGGKKYNTRQAGESEAAWRRNMERNKGVQSNTPRPRPDTSKPSTSVSDKARGQSPTPTKSLSNRPTSTKMSGSTQTGGAPEAKTLSPAPTSSKMSGSTQTGGTSTPSKPKTLNHAPTSNKMGSNSTQSGTATPAQRKSATDKLRSNLPKPSNDYLRQQGATPSTDTTPQLGTGTNPSLIKSSGTKQYGIGSRPGTSTKAQRTSATDVLKRSLSDRVREGSSANKSSSGSGQYNTMSKQKTSAATNISNAVSGKPTSVKTTTVPGPASAKTIPGSAPTIPSGSFHKVITDNKRK